MQSAFSLADQLLMFNEYAARVKALVGEERRNYILANSVCLLVAGNNDFLNTYFGLTSTRLQYTISSYANLLIDSASTVIQVLYIYVHFYIYLPY